MAHQRARLASNVATSYALDAASITTGDNEMSEELKPCPFCGKDCHKTTLCMHNETLVECNNKKCALFGRIMKTSTWNTRTPPEQNCKSFCKLFASAKTRDEFFAEKCRICKEGRTEDKWASFHERRNK
jgi:hypothetical protein